MDEVYKKEEDAFGLSCAMEYFSDYDEVITMINNLATTTAANSDVGLVEGAHERFIEIFKKYQEQPHLMDVHLDEILTKMIAIIRSPVSSMQLKHETFKYMFVITNVRGYKIIVRQLPHEVSDFEPVLRLLEDQDPQDNRTWTTRYILLLWMSIIVMIPFHMSRLDGFAAEQAPDRKTVMQRVLHVCQTYVVVPDKCRDAASFLISKFLTRSDVKEAYLNEFLSWAIERSSAERSNCKFVKYGALASVAMILKHGKRDDILPYAPKLLTWIIDDTFKSDTGSIIQKLIHKIMQRIGLVFLPPKIAKWRYKRGNRALLANFSGGMMNDANKMQMSDVDEQEDVDVDVPDELEEIFDQLIHGLKHEDSIVRWSAAKGIGRITGRLPKRFADEVVGFVLDLFSPREGDGAWHGGCLALAELGRRGLLLPARLPDVVPVVMTALVYDEPKGYASVGAHIRDAACYVCWSFARAYDVHDMQPFLDEIAAQLLIVSCYDREINCRRAASAAFQEHVGRQGGFPHGIDILSTADFFSVSVRNNSYLHISVYIAQFEEYTFKLIDHLVERKVSHWDIVIRELTAKTMHNLTPLAHEYMLSIVLPKLFDRTLSIDLNARHGSILAIGECFVALSNMGKRRLFNKLANHQHVRSARELITTCRTRHYFRGLGGELMKLACCSFIHNCSLAHLEFQNEDTIDDWFQLLKDCLVYDVPNIRQKSVATLAAFLNEYYVDKKEKQSRLVDDFIKELQSEKLEIVRMGHALALGVLPQFILDQHLERIIEALLSCLVITSGTAEWSESRRDVINALSSIIERTGKGCSDEHILRIYNALLEGLNEYVRDKQRGDIGAWVREASMNGLKTITLKLPACQRHLLSEALVERILTHIAQQAVEKIDRMRVVAGRTFYALIYSNNIPNIPNHEEVKSIFKNCENLNWNSASAVCPIFAELLQFPKYTYRVLLGFICSIGGMAESLVKHSTHAFIAYLDKQFANVGKPEIVRICDTALQIFVDNAKVDRITVPLLRFFEKLFASGRIAFILADEESEFAKRVLQSTQSELAGCADIYKLMDGINLLCQFVQVNTNVCKTALVHLSILLCHRRLYVRKSTAAKLFEAILICGENSVIPSENLDQVQNLLSDTAWEDPVEKVREVRNQICVLMDIRVPVMKIK